MAEVIRRLETTKLEPYEFNYVSDLYQYEIMTASMMILKRLLVGR
ncbi:MAG: hypothetical protein U5L45_10615 [Saprospiraceae bacterium]|nr:hypothetical protein [Saprospiraceae bacterium]